MAKHRAMAVEIAGSLSLIIVGLIALSQMFGNESFGVRDPIGTFGMPRIYAGMLIAFGLMLLPYGDMMRKYRGIDVDEADDGLAEAESAGDDATPHTLVARLLPYAPIVGIILYAALIPILGFATATTILGAILLYTMGVRRVRMLILVPVGMSAFVWLIFGQLLGVTLPTGLLI